MLGTSFSCCLHWNIIILLKVDTSVSVGEQLSRNNTQSSRHKYYTSGHSNTVKPLTKGHSERGQTSQQTIIITWHLSIPHTHAPFHTIITWHLSITHTHLSTRSLRGICLSHTRTFPHDHYVAFVYHTHTPFHTIITWHLSTRRMFVIETASRAWKITILIKRSKVRKVNHAFLPEGIQIEDLTQASCHA